MKNIYLTEIKKGDFLIELFSLACSAYNAISSVKKALVIDTTQFDVSIMTKRLLKYDLQVFEKENLDVELSAVFYGKGKNVIDLCDKVEKMELKKIPANISLNSLKGDPAPGKKKELFVAYSLNEVDFSETYMEERDADIVLDLSLVKTHTDFFWIDWVNRDIYDSVLKSIVLKETGKCVENSHLVHVLSPEDIESQSQSSGKSKDVFYDALLNKYKELITKFIKPGEHILFVQKEMPLELLTFLQDRNPYGLLDTKDPLSFSIAVQATGNFIGNFNMDTLTGSSCSYYLHTVSQCNQSILIDLDNLFE